MKTKKNSKPAFTLVELILVIAIMAVLSVSAYNSIINSTDQQKFQDSFDEILSYFRLARSDALANKTVPDFTDADGNGIFFGPDNPDERTTPAGFGVAISDDPPTIFYFADIIPPFEGSQWGTSGNFEYCPNSTLNGCDLIYKTYEPTNINIELLGDNDETNYESAFVIFAPFSADLTIGGEVVGNSKLRLKITDPKNLNRCRIIETRAISSSIEQLSC